MSAAGGTLEGFAIAARPLAGEVISIPADGLKVTEGKVLSGDFPVAIYEAYPADEGKYPAVLVIPGIFGMYYHVKEIAYRFAKEGFLTLLFRPHALEEGVLNLPGIVAVRKVA